MMGNKILKYDSLLTFPKELFVEGYIYTFGTIIYIRMAEEGSGVVSTVQNKTEITCCDSTSPAFPFLFGR